MSIDRRTSGYRQLVEATPTYEDLMTEEIDGELYQYRKEPRCRICNPETPSITRIVDELLLVPKTYAEVHRTITPLLEEQDLQPISYDTIRNHQKNHLPVEKQVVREIIERRAREQNLSILDGTQRILTAEAFLETVSHKVFSAMNRGLVTPSVREGIDATLALRQLESQIQSGPTQAEMVGQVQAIIEAVKSVCTEEQLKEIVELLETHEEYTDLEEVAEGELVE